MFSKNHPIILFIDRNGFSLFQDVQPNILRFNFTPDIVENLDVVNKEQFSNLIATFIQINKIIPSSIVAILSDTAIYSKDLILQKIGKEREEEAKNFLDNVPFEEILAKVISADQASRIVAVNKDLVMTVINVLLSKGSSIEGIIPGFLYGSSAGLNQSITSGNVRVILEESEIAKAGNLLTDQQEISHSQSSMDERKYPISGGEKKPQNIRQNMLISVFVALLIILVVVYLNLGASQTLPNKKNKTYSVKETVTPTVVSASQAPVYVGQISFKDLRIKIIKDSQSNIVADNLKSKFEQEGFLDIVSEISDTVAEKPSIIFSQDIPLSIRDIMVGDIRKNLPDIFVSENQDSNLTITILMGKPQSL